MFSSLKVDKQLASGEYFLKEKEKRLKAQEEKKVFNWYVSSCVVPKARAI